MEAERTFLATVIPISALWAAGHYWTGFLYAGAWLIYFAIHWLERRRKWAKYRNRLTSRRR